MICEIKLPQEGANMTEGDIGTWKVAVGDTVAKDQVLAEVEVAKATIEVNSPYAGKIVSLEAEEGDTVKVGDPIATIEV
jgi:2-oxoisovalerate dehydrogenase E2 component (dihydrolipoyl transacylase)